MNDPKRVAKAQRWLKKYLKKSGWTDGRLAWDNGDTFRSDRYNVWINGHVEVYVVANLASPRRGNVVVQAYVNRCGPDARSTCDGPIENDHTIINFYREWVEFDDAAYSQMMEFVRKHTELVEVSFYSEVAKFIKNL